MPFNLSNPIFLGTALLIALSGCGGSSSNDKPADTTKRENIELKDTTDRSSCTGAPNYSVNSKWSSTLGGSSEHVAMNMTVTFDLTNSGYVTISNLCDINGTRATASATVPVSITANTIVFLGSAKDKGHSESGTSQADCSVDITPKTLNYSVIGSCLRMESDGKTFYGVHQSF